MNRADKIKEEKNWKESLSAIGEFCCERNRYIMPAVKGAVNFQLLQRKVFVVYFTILSVFAGLYRLECYGDWCRMGWKVA